MEHDLEALINQANQIILGKDRQIRLAVCCLLAKGHLLIEDLPGVGKTTLSHALAKLFGMDYQRLQFTSDLLPADIIGSSVFMANEHAFKFHPGPIFRQMILADEINRASPKAQSALLEAMEERQVTVDGETYALPELFFVIATQNPNHHVGTFSLPESQLDRFLMRIELGYPDHRAELSLLSGEARYRLLEDLPVMMPAERLLQLQDQVARVYASPALLNYVLAVVTFTRQSDQYHCGLSPRAGLALLNAAKAWALLANRDAVLPEDVQAVLPAVAGHRIRSGVGNSEAIVAPILQNVPVV
ncbi:MULTISPECIES: AAA family ATPase [Methylotuvimicrobium]|uniref:AAA ATPase n=2 Tax=Methylotuvimicrobium TaxID=2822410 RepID=G4SYH9_META2|nr:MULTISPECIES: MoxR family ATPase [Methylotuvimicrobium]QCW84168.1 MoxR family ATPase [Methylotuvimicrobium buryatense]CCE22183.1 Putative AAA ATPase [Methylotuvimicrobium alcaliphilum 20Z]